MDFNYNDQERLVQAEEWLLMLDHMQTSWERIATPFSPSWEDILRESIRRLIGGAPQPTPPPRIRAQLRVLQDNYHLALIVAAMEALIIILLLAL